MIVIACERLRDEQSWGAAGFSAPPPTPSSRAVRRRRSARLKRVAAPERRSGQRWSRARCLQETGVRRRRPAPGTRRPLRRAGIPKTPKSGLLREEIATTNELESGLWGFACLAPVKKKELKRPSPGRPPRRRKQRSNTAITIASRLCGDDLILCSQGSGAALHQHYGRSCG